MVALQSNTEMYIDTPEDYDDDFDYYCSFNEIYEEDTNIPCILMLKFNDFDVEKLKIPYLKVKSLDNEILGIILIEHGVVYSGNIHEDLLQKIRKFISINFQLLQEHFYGDEYDCSIGEYVTGVHHAV